MSSGCSADARSKSAMHVTTEIDAERRVWPQPVQHAIRERVAFFDVDDARPHASPATAPSSSAATAARATRRRCARTPVRRVGAALDPCAAIQVAFELADGEQREIVFRLGAASDADARAATWCIACARSGAAQSRWTPSCSTGGTRSAACRSTRPTPRSTCWPTAGSCTRCWRCRVWARSGFYQSGGAFGFRDQLQDVMALVHAEPALAARADPALRRRQFRGGRRAALVASAVGGRGVRTQLLRRLPLAAARDVPLRAGHRRRGRLDESVHFLEGRPAQAGAKSPITTCPAGPRDARSLYEHCVRAIAAWTAIRRARPAADGRAATGTTA